MRRICVVITARPSYSRIKTALEAIRAHKDLELQIVVCASAILERYGNVAEVIERDGFEIEEKLYTVVEGDAPQTMAKTTGLGMVDLASTFARLKPDIVVTIADRYETLATAATAAYMNIPLMHIQGGEVTGSIDDKVRNAVTQLADVHCVATKAAGGRVVAIKDIDREEPYWGTPYYKNHNVHITGCPSIDLATQGLMFGEWILEDGVGHAIDPSEAHIVVMQHPVTDEHEKAFGQATVTAEAVRECGYQALWFWPNIDSGSDGTSKALRVFRERYPEAPVRFFRNLEPKDFLAVAAASRCIVGNSSFGIREASFLGLPAVNIGTRQSGRERGPNVVDVPHDRDAIKAAIEAQAGKRHPESHLYGDGHAGERIADVLAKMDLQRKAIA